MCKNMDKSDNRKHQVSAYISFETSASNISLTSFTISKKKTTTTKRTPSYSTGADLAQRTCHTLLLITQVPALNPLCLVTTYRLHFILQVC